MTRKEAEKIAWELLRIIEVPEGGHGIYGSSHEIANAAIEVVYNIKKQFPKISDAIDFFSQPTVEPGEAG